MEKSAVEEFEQREFRLEVAKIRWAYKMYAELGPRKSFDYGHEIGRALTVSFARWPECGVLTVSWPLTWWDHLKRTLRWKFPYIFRGLRWREHTEIHEAMLVLPAIDLPDDMKEGSFAVFHKKRVN